MSLAFRNSCFSLSLPAGWNDASEADAIAFASPTTGEELVVGVHAFIRPLDNLESAGVTWDLVQQRAAACGQLANGALEILEAVQPSAEAQTAVGGFSANDKLNRVYCQAKVIGQRTFAVSFSYYKHSCTAPSREVETRAREILTACLVAADT
jgi:hypothetical protein